MDKNQVQERQLKIIDHVREFCDKSLNAEYFELSEKLIQKLGCKKNVPFLTGKSEIWAAAVIHALGTINFLFDKASEPYVTVDEINVFFETNKSTVTGKSKLIRDLLKLSAWDNEFSTNRMNEVNPFDNLVMVDGLIVPLNTLPEEYQLAVRQARAEGKDVSFTTK